MKGLLVMVLVVLSGSAIQGSVDPNTDKVTCPILTAVFTCWPECALYNKGIPNCCKAGWTTFECTCVPVAGDLAQLSISEMVKAQVMCGVDSVLGFFTNEHHINPSKRAALRGA